MFLKAIELFRTARAQHLGAAVFDKEDLLACEFVTAAANLRSIVFGIPTQSLFDTKVTVGKEDSPAGSCALQAGLSAAITADVQMRCPMSL